MSEVWKIISLLLIVQKKKNLKMGWALFILFHKLPTYMLQGLLE